MRDSEPRVITHFGVVGRGLVAVCGAAHSLAPVPLARAREDACPSRACRPPWASLQRSPSGAAVRSASIWRVGAWRTQFSRPSTRRSSTRRPTRCCTWQRFWRKRVARRRQHNQRRVPPQPCPRVIELHLSHAHVHQSTVCVCVSGCGHPITSRWRAYVSRST